MLALLNVISSDGCYLLLDVSRYVSDFLVMFSYFRTSDITFSLWAFHGLAKELFHFHPQVHWEAQPIAVQQGCQTQIGDEGVET